MVPDAPQSIDARAVEAGGWIDTLSPLSSTVQPTAERPARKWSQSWERSGPSTVVAPAASRARL